VRRRPGGWWIAPLALTAGLLVKGVFVAVPLLAAGWWLLTNPLDAPGSAGRAIAAVGLSLAAMLAVAVGYDALYLRVTGETFWGPYWSRQLAPLSLSAPLGSHSTFGAHLWFYLVRMAWHPAPWSVLLIAALWRWRGSIGERWRAIAPRSRRGLIFLLGFAVSCVLILTPASRFAERYAFSANYALATAGALVTLQAWPSFGAWLAGWDRRIPALPALCWLALMLLRLALGPFLPRISA
jgi:hypothetical protein